MQTVLSLQVNINVLNDIIYSEGGQRLANFNLPYWFPSQLSFPYDFIFRWASVCWYSRFSSSGHGLTNTFVVRLPSPSSFGPSQRRALWLAGLRRLLSRYHSARRFRIRSFNGGLTSTWRFCRLHAALPPVATDKCHDIPLPLLCSSAFAGWYSGIFSSGCVLISALAIVRFPSLASCRHSRPFLDSSFVQYHSPAVSPIVQPFTWPLWFDIHSNPKHIMLLLGTNSGLTTCCCQ
jgi:hypothetical protein